MIDLEAIEARANAATPGPWTIGKERGDPAVFPTTCAVDCPVAVMDPLHKAGDAPFIAAARTDIPALVAEVRRLREALGAVVATTQAALDDLGAYYADGFDPSPATGDAADAALNHARTLLGAPHA